MNIVCKVDNIPYVDVLFVTTKRHYTILKDFNYTLLIDYGESEEVPSILEVSDNPDVVSFVKKHFCNSILQMTFANDESSLTVQEVLDEIIAFENCESTIVLTSDISIRYALSRIDDSYSICLHPREHELYLLIDKKLLKYKWVETTQIKEI